MAVDINKLLERIDSADEDTLEHYGVLGMRWGVRKDRRTGKRVGKPVKGTKAASRSTPSVSPKPGTKKRRGVTQTVRKQNNRPAPKPKPQPKKSTPKPEQKSAPKTPPAKGMTVVLPDGRTARVTKVRQMSEQEFRKSVKDLKIDKEPTIAKVKNPSKASTADLQAAVNRIKLEQEYKRLTASPPSRKQRLRAATGKVLASVAETQAKRFGNAVVAHYSDSFLKSVGIKPGGGTEKKKQPQQQQQKEKPKKTTVQRSKRSIQKKRKK